MKYKITKFQLFLLDWIARKLVVQGPNHKRNIVAYYKVIADAAHDEFREDNLPTLNAFLNECHRKSLVR